MIFKPDSRATKIRTTAPEASDKQYKLTRVSSRYNFCGNLLLAIPSMRVLDLTLPCGRISTQRSIGKRPGEKLKSSKTPNVSPWRPRFFQNGISRSSQKVNQRRPWLTSSKHFLGGGHPAPFPYPIPRHFLATFGSLLKSQEPLP